MRLAQAFARIRAFMSVQKDNPALLLAQHRAFSYQVPLLYFMLLVNTWALASSFMGHAPDFLTLWCPVAATLAGLARIGGWVRVLKRPATLEIAVRDLERTNGLAWVIGIGFAVWSLSLFPYGNAYMQGHLAFYMAITVVGCIFCLMHLRPAAFAIAGVVNVAFVIFFGLSGNPIFIAISVNVALVTATMLVILMVYYRDFTRMVETQARTEALNAENMRLANVDSLTNLPNRRRFFSLLENTVIEAQAKGTVFAVGVIDLDGFKAVNDIHGHATGDRLLAEIGLRLLKICDGKAAVARLGGDEFALIVPDMTAEDLLSFGDGLCAALHDPVSLPEATVRVGGSLGFAVYPEMAQDAGTLFERADYALYNSKRGKRGHAVLFSSEHAAAIHRDARIEQALGLADLERELSVVFQPVIDATTGEAVGFEALARWDNPVLGSVRPDIFISVAERSGLIGEVSRTLLKKALHVAETWPEGMRLSFNLSAHDLSHAGGVLRLVAIIAGAGFDTRRLDLEITETAVMHDFDEVVRAIETFKTMGCGISLDDFGTGYASLSQLHALPLTRIKIDRSFVAGMDSRPASVKIVKSVLALSRDMGLDCVIEGVETEAELTVLRKLGGRYMQGYLFAAPMPAADIAAFLGEGSPQPVAKAV